MMIEHNADPLLHNNRGYGAHSISYFNDFHEASLYLAEAGMRKAIETLDYRNMQIMVQDGASVNTQTSTGATALMVACHAGEEDMVRWLLNHPHTQTDFQENDGWTAMMFAVYFNHLNIIQLLMDHGVDLGVLNFAGQTALSLAELHDRVEAAAMLKERITLIESRQQEIDHGNESEEVQKKITESAASGSGDGSIRAEVKEPAAKPSWKLW